MSSTTATPRNDKFPVKLHRLLSDVETKGYEDIISWSPDGESFRVHNKERFEQHIMPFYFGSSKFRSFQKNLNMWGFTAARGGSLRGLCSHPLFRRDSPNLCRHIVRQHVPSSIKMATSLPTVEKVKSSKTGVDKASAPDTSVKVCSPGSTPQKQPQIINVNPAVEKVASSSLLSQPKRFPIATMMKNLQGLQEGRPSSHTSTAETLPTSFSNKLRQSIAGSVAVATASPLELLAATRPSSVQHLLSSQGTSPILFENVDTDFDAMRVRQQLLIMSMEEEELRRRKERILAERSVLLLREGILTARHII